jgi:osmotically-inducible protein OsmY
MPKEWLMKRPDERIKKDVAEHLMGDGRLDASDVGVRVDDGIVILSGIVSTYSERIAAEEDAVQVIGVRRVDNEIEVDSNQVKGTADHEVQMHIERVLAWAPGLDSAQIDVSVDHGSVQFEGAVASSWDKTRVEKLGTMVRGVTRVTNKLSVVPCKDLADKVIARNIVAAIDRHADVCVEDVVVKVARKTVILSGTVPTWSARRAAHDAALYTRGVIDICDDLVVEGANQ